MNRRLSAKPTKAVAKSTGLAGQAVELEISLLYIKPRIWRRFVVPGDIKLHKLHAIIQVVMGWTNSHLHAFRVDQHEYVQRDPGDPGWQETMSDMIIRDERKHTLSDLVMRKGDAFNYTYDFGDDWEHVVKVKSITPSPEPLKFVFCVHGERACPPEDCGSIPGYEDICAALPDPEHPRHAELVDWIGEYDPARFDVDEVNELLRQVRI